MIPIHIGLLGHVDAGKTSIARKLTEVVSTAGLDKHPQSKERGITIDLGFTFFQLQEYMITLVDAPGHADLIQSVVSAANIIDIAFIVIDATRGPQVQTGEHLIILDLFHIPKVYALINKIDAVDENQLEKVRRQTLAMFNDTQYKENGEIFLVSAQLNQGFDEIKNSLIQYLNDYPPHRDRSSPFKFLFDHHFAKKGQGTILTGNVLNGSAHVGDNIIILPPEIKTKIKSIQKAKQASDIAEAGDRAGIGVSELNPTEIFRGCIAVKDKSPFIKTEILMVHVFHTLLFKHGCVFGQQITINHGMMVLSGRIFPFITEIVDNEQYRMRLDLDPSIQEYDAIIWLEHPEFIEIEDKILLSRLDLPPTTLRIMGIANITQSVKEDIEFTKIKVKQGRVKNAAYSDHSVIVEGLAASVEGARTMLNKICDPPFGKILSTFGSKGNVEVEFIANETYSVAEVGQSVKLKIRKEYSLDKKASYD
jgi:selenocysteine-specific elongation factor